MKIYESTLILLALSVGKLRILPASANDRQGDNCHDFTTCSACLQHIQCAWCADPVYEDRGHVEYKSFKSRCGGREEIRVRCKNSSYVQDFSSAMQTVKNESTKIGNDNEDTVLISPQILNLELRLNDAKTFEMKYKDPGDKWLDLYYLMDLSDTMKDDKATVADQGKNLAESLKKLTKKLLLGFGSFIDKPIVPFSSSKQLSGTSGKVIPYSFKNHMPLGEDVSQFQEEVRGAMMSTNLDRPEGTFDALMQAMVCKDVIGWRDGSRKLIVVSTDGPFHIAGDGKLLGIIEPNDMQCHMVNNYYTHFDRLDYPSVAQINQKAKDESVYLVFAVTTDQMPMYQTLARHIESATAVELRNDSSNVVEIITKEYQKIKETLKLRQFPPRVPGINITYKYTCGEEEKTSRDGSIDCAIAPESEQKFQIKVELTDCKALEGRNEDIVVTICQAVDCPTQNLTLRIRARCHCDCEKDSEIVKYSEQARRFCQGKGDIVCGQCRCGGNYAGRNCQCNKKSDDSLSEQNCLRNGVGGICSGRGKCQCGICNCDEEDDTGRRFMGRYCEYDHTNCKNEAGEVCSSHGDCVEGHCRCNPGYEGTLCNCIQDKSPCREPGSLKDCNGRASCECPESGKNETRLLKQCISCDDGYTGEYCHVPSGTAVASECKDQNIRNCVNCIVEGGGLKAMNLHVPSKCQGLCSGNKTTRGVPFEVEVVKELERKDSYLSCEYKKDDCTVRFFYSYEGSRMTVKLLQRQDSDCPELPWWIIATVVGSIVLIGILTLLIWKVVTHIHDTKEYERFEKDREREKWAKGTNPLYASPQAEFQNPVYRGR